MQIHHDGEFVEVDGRPAVRFVRSYPYPAQRLWEAVSEPSQLRHWFPSPIVEYEARQGGAIRLSGDPYEPEGSTGTVLEWDPPRRFGFDWGSDQLFLTVTEDGEGCRLELLNILVDRGGAARNASGWDFCLAGLDDALRDTPSDVHAGGMGEFRPVLEAYKAQGLPDDGWLPGSAS